VKKAGIVSYGTYIPRYRLKIEGMEKSVPGIDEDAITLAIAAAKDAIDAVRIDPRRVESLLIGSESHPYAVKPSSTVVGEILGLGNKYLAADLEFACKAGSAGIQLTAGLIESGHIDYGLSIGADTAQAAPGDALERTSAAGAAAYLLGRGDTIATLLSYTSFSSDTPDFWRRDGQTYPSHAGRFTGEPAYFSHIEGAANLLIKKAKINLKDIDWCVFHMPNSKFPREVARRLGFTPKQIAPSLVIDSIGNPYSASSLLGLAATLDGVKPGDSIFMVSYGSGAGSDAFLWQVNKKIVQIQKYRKRNKILVHSQILNKEYVDYAKYLKLTHKI
jgi:hydroxymethylglutaryl-CoA synthase